MGGAGFLDTCKSSHQRSLIRLNLLLQTVQSEPYLTADYRRMLENRKN